VSNDKSEKELKFDARSTTIHELNVYLFASYFLDLCTVK
jgi:hypothetical protein